MLETYFEFRKLEVNLAVKCVFSFVDVEEDGAGQEEGRSCGEHGGYFRAREDGSAQEVGLDNHTSSSFNSPRIEA